MKNTKEFLIAKRGEYMPFDEAILVQKELIEIYKKEYIPKHTKSEYYDLILEYGVGEIKERHEQDNNWPDKVYSCFSVVSQHTRGFTKEHCLDLIFEAVKRQKDHIELWETLPTIEDLINSNIKILEGEEYQTKVNNKYINKNKGSDIIEMRAIGLSKWRLKQYEMFAPQ